MAPSPLDYRHVEEGESEVERFVKYVRFISIASSAESRTIANDLAAFFLAAEPIWERMRQRAKEGLTYAELVKSAEVSLFVLDRVSEGYFDVLNRLLSDKAEARINFLSHLNNTSSAALEAFSKEPIQSMSYRSLRKELDELRAEAGAINDGPASDLRILRLAHINAAARLDARLQLLKIKVCAMENSKKRSSRFSFLGRSLAKSDRWEGNGSDRITSRRANMYRINRV